MNKKYLIVLAGVVILIIIVFFIQQSTIQQTRSKLSSSHNQNSANVSQTIQTGEASSPSVTLAPPANTALEATKQFYTYYFSSPVNPLANGAYKNNPYLSQSFKGVIGSLYNNGNKSVFCAQNGRANITVGNERTYYYNNSYLTQEVISEASPVTKELYRVTLENDGGKWTIFDINCL